MSHCDASSSSQEVFNSLRLAEAAKMQDFNEQCIVNTLCAMGEAGSSTQEVQGLDVHSIVFNSLRVATAA